VNGDTPPPTDRDEQPDRSTGDALDEAASFLTDDAAKAATVDAGIELIDEPSPWLLDEAAGALIDLADTAPVEVPVDNGGDGQKAESSIDAAPLPDAATTLLIARVDPRDRDLRLLARSVEHNRAAGYVDAKAYEDAFFRFAFGVQSGAPVDRADIRDLAAGVFFSGDSGFAETAKLDDAFRRLEERIERRIKRREGDPFHSDQPTATGRSEPVGAWDPVDVAEVLADDPNTRVEATILRRSDGVGLLYAGQVNGLVGEPESLKSWLALVGCLQELERERHVFYIDLEDNPQSVILKRLHRDLGVAAGRLRTFFHYFRPDEPITNRDARARLLAAAAKWSPSFAVVDGVTEALSLHGLSSASDVDVAALAALLTRPLADLGAAVLPVDHVVKDAEQRGRWPTGSQHKLSAVGGAAYAIHVVQVARRGAQDGLSRVVVTKDRPGAVRSHATAGGTVAEFHFGSSADGVVRWRLDPPDEGPFRPTHLMERVSRYLEGETEERSQAAILKAVTGKESATKAAIGCLLKEGFVVTSDGPHGATLHRSVRPFREAE
jgi:AAA domain